MIEVELPDGSIAEFPEGTTQEVMQSAIRSHLSPPAAPQPSEQDRARARMGFRRSKEEAIAQSEAIPDAPLPSAQTVLDLLGSGGLGAAGMMAGAPAGPTGSIALGGAGAAAGKRIARDLGALFGLEGSESYPSAGESTLDAAGGAAGPAVSAVARPVARAVTGVSRKSAEAVQGLRGKAREVKELIGEAADEVKKHKARMAEQPFGAAVETATGQSSKAEAAKLSARLEKLSGDFKQADKALVDRIAKSVGESGTLPKDAGKLGALVMGVAHGDLMSAAALFGLGQGVSKVRVAAARRLLANERALEWVLEKAKGGITPARLLGSLGALAAVKGISPQVKRDIRTLQAGETEGMREDRDALERMMRLD